MTKSLTTPKPKETWQHRNNGLYIIEGVTNTSSTNPSYTPQVVYRGVANGLLWSKPLDKWHQAMRLVRTANGAIL